MSWPLSVCLNSAHGPGRIEGAGSQGKEITLGCGIASSIVCCSFPSEYLLTCFTLISSLNCELVRVVPLCFCQVLVVSIHEWYELARTSDGTRHDRQLCWDLSHWFSSQSVPSTWIQHLLQGEAGLLIFMSLEV